MRILTALFVCLMMVSGCTVIEGFVPDSQKAQERIAKDREMTRSELLRVNYSDGINKQEAIAVAGNFLIQNQADKFWKLKSPVVKNAGDFWSVMFSARNPLSFEEKKREALEILVLKSDGTIPDQETSKLP